MGDGILVARGVPENSIIFTAELAGEDNGWDGIAFGRSRQSAQFDAMGDYISGPIIEHAIIVGRPSGLGIRLSAGCR